jgi:SAM-dependent methyltransferase
MPPTIEGPPHADDGAGPDAPRFDLDEVFDDDYLFFYADFLSEERTAREVALIERLLEVGPGLRLLDAGCGHGRIANRLAALGARVTGLDRSAAFLDQAQQDAAARGVQVDYVLGDLRSLGWDGEFDAVLCWFTTFGYFADAENRAVLAGLRRALVPGGRLLLELNNRELILRQPQPDGIEERDGAFMLDRRAYDPLSGRMETERIVVRDGRVRRMRYGTRLFTFPELRDWLHAAGFTRVEAFDEQGEPFSLAARRMVVRATAGTA